MTRTRIIDLAGIILVFTAFTQPGLGGGQIYLIYFLPILLAFLFLCIFLGALKIPKIKIQILLICVVIILAHISVFSLQYIVPFAILSSFFMLAPIPFFAERLPFYSFCAMILNILIYFGEIALNQIGVPFDASIFNYIDSGREGLITTWGFSRYSAHHTEPGSFAINLAGLAVLSLVGQRPPGIFHWLAALTLLTVLSITAALMALMVIIAILISGGVRVKSIFIFITGLGATVFALLNFVPNLGVDTMGFFSHRLVDRGGTDGSIWVKSQLIDDLLHRDALASLMGNRNQPCEVCMYSKSLGFGFNLLFEGGLLGAVIISALSTITFYRFGLPGLLLIFTFFSMRLEFYYPQTIVLVYAIFMVPATVGRRYRFASNDPAATVTWKCPAK